METGSELSKTVATFIVQKILLDEIGLSYVCATAERFYAVSTVLSNMFALLVGNPRVRLLKHIVCCYLRLSDNIRAREALRQCLPAALRDETFGNALRDDMTVKKWLSQLLSVVGPPAAPGDGSGNNNVGGGGGGSGSNQGGGGGSGGGLVLPTGPATSGGGQQGQQQQQQPNSTGGAPGPTLGGLTGPAGVGGLGSGGGGGNGK